MLAHRMLAYLFYSGCEVSFSSASQREAKAFSLRVVNDAPERESVLGSACFVAPRVLGQLSSTFLADALLGRAEVHSFLHVSWCPGCRVSFSRLPQQNPR